MVSISALVKEVKSTLSTKNPVKEKEEKKSPDFQHDYAVSLSSYPGKEKRVQQGIQAFIASKIYNSQSH